MSIGLGWTLLPDNTLRHTTTSLSNIGKSTSTLVDGGEYTVEITLSNYTSGDLYLTIGDNTSPIFNNNGTYQYTFTHSGNSLVNIYSDGIVDVTYISLVSEFLSDLDVDLDDDTIFANKSFTVSFDPIREKWISYHSYIPQCYIPHTTDYLKYNSLDIEVSDNNEYQSDMPFIIETVFNDNPTLTRVTDNISVNSEAYFNDARINKFFDKLLVYTDQQISGELILDSSRLTRKEKDWNINKFLDISTEQSNKQLFSTDWEDIKDSYFIDKVINTDGVDTTKPWYQRARFRDKYIVARFICNNLDQKKLIVNFVNSVHRLSTR